MIYLFGYKPVISAREEFHGEKTIKDHIRKWILSSKDEIFIKNAIIVNNLDYNEDLFVKTDEYFNVDRVLVNNQDLCGSSGYNMRHVYNVFIMLMKEFCEVNVE